MGKGGGSGSGAYDYYGTIAGVVCAGPVDELVEIVVDGKTVWPKATLWAVGQSITAGDLRTVSKVVYQALSNHTTSAGNKPPNATFWQRYSVKRATSTNPVQITVENYGAAWFYWGTANQTLDTSGEKVLSDKGHPAYRRQAVMVLKNFLFGRERTSAPNVEVVVRRAPNQSIITGDPAALSDGQANAFAALAELYTDNVFGAGLVANAVGGPDSTTWQAAATGIHTDVAQTAISPILTGAESLRAFTAAILAYCDGWARFNADGLIQAGWFPHNTTPPTFTAATTIDFHDLVDEADFTAEGFASTFNQTQVTFKDRERAFKDGSAAAVSGYNLAVTAEPRVAKIDRPWITRRQQASDHAAEWQKINSEPKLAGSLVVRAEKAVSINPGDYFLLTHDALAISVICRCIAKDSAQPPAGRATIRFENDRAMAPVPYQPTPTPDSGSAFPANETLTLQQFFQPPPSMLGAATDATLCPLIARTSPVTTGANVWFQKDDVSGFYLLGSVSQFAITGTLQQNYATTSSDEDNSEDLRVTLDAGTDASDLAKMLTTQTEDAINDAAVVVVIFNQSNAKQFEVATLRAMRIVGAETFYRLKVRRARFGTAQRSAVTGDRAFIVYRSDLIALTHEAFVGYLSALSTTTFRLQSVNAESVADLADTSVCPNVSYTWADPYAPSFTFDSVKAGTSEITDFATNYSTTTDFTVTATITDASADLIEAKLFARLGTTEVALWNQTFSASSRQTITTTFRLPSNGEWQVFISGKDRSGRVRQKQLTAGGGSSTVTLKIGVGTGGSIVATPTSSPAPGGYTNNTLSVSLSCSTSGATIKYSLVAIGAAAGTFSTYSSAVTVAIGAGGKSLYAYAEKAGLTTSPTVRLDYWKEVSEYFPPGTQPP